METSMKGFTSLVPTVLTLGLLAGCVASSGGVAPTFVDPAKYNSLSCSELISEKSNNAMILAELSGKQDTARSRGIAYNILLIPGAGALAKDRAPEIGETKGNILALESNIAQRCGNDRAE
jgi:hypothetical protein